MKLTPCQKKALKQLHSDANIFLTGKAGTGKSYLISHYLKDKDSRKEFPVLASTGAAAVLIGGRTFHSFFGLGVMAGSYEDVIAKAVKNRNVRYRIRKAETIVIDEISMLSGTTLAAAEEIARQSQKSNEPWGGLRVIAVGDFAQLPPVSQNHQRDWAFLNEVWERTKFEPLSLETVVRTKEEKFISLLNEVREGKISPELSDFFQHRTTVPEEFDGTRLFPFRKSTDKYNLERLQNLPGELKLFRTQYSGNLEYAEYLKRQAPIPEVLHLKVGALVMIRVNDPQLRYVNGSVGRVVDIGEDQVFVKVDHRTLELQKVTFSYFNGDGKELASALNFPLSLAWASTIHKAQGSTLEKVLLDLEGLWEPGHAYVALSRAKSVNGIYVSRWSPKGIHCDPSVLEFYQQGCPHNFISRSEYSQKIQIDNNSFEEFN